MMEDSRTTIRSDSIRCPFCQVYDLEQPSGSNSAHCTSCRVSLNTALLTTLWEIQTLPDALGSHPCEECHHPEMRRLPDGVYHCFACGSEVVPAKGSELSRGGGPRAVVSEAYLSGWRDGIFGSQESFVHNRELARWEDATDRLDYYRGHHAGRQAYLWHGEAASRVHPKQRS
jgi:hypothetical protein